MVLVAIAGTIIGGLVCTRKIYDKIHFDISFIVFGL
jgi:hypothetical protein